MLFWFLGLMAFRCPRSPGVYPPRSCGVLHHRSHFGALSLYGYTTKRDMSDRIVPVHGLIGIIIASLVNLFWRARCCSHGVVIGVLIFAG